MTTTTKRRRGRPVKGWASPDDSARRILHLRIRQQLGLNGLRYADPPAFAFMTVHDCGHWHIEHAMGSGMTAFIAGADHGTP